MDYNKNIFTRYVGFKLFFFNLIYFSLLLILLTPSEITREILTTSSVVFISICGIYLYLFANLNAKLNVPNAITNCRLVINIFLLIVVTNMDMYGNILILSLITISLALDGLDGYLSRYLGQITRFGRLFDQEVDNFLILILVVSLIHNFSFSPYILLIPFYRYIFIFLMQSNIISNQDLPESFFRKAICVVTILGLVIANLYHNVESTEGLLYIITVAISYSFFIDILYLYRRKNA